MKSPTITLPTPLRVILPDAPGKIQIIAATVRVAQFASATGYSARYVRQLCDEGRIEHRRRDPGNENSPILIPVAELHRFLTPA